MSARTYAPRDASHPSHRSSLPTAKRPATQAQIDFIDALLGDIAKICTETEPEGNREWALQRRQDYADRVKAGRFTTADASATLAELQATKTELKAVALPAKTVKATEAKPQVPPGRYAVDNDAGKLAFYTVTVSDKGFVKVKVHSSDERIELAWSQALAVLRKIEKATPAVAGKRFANETNECWRCGHELTDEESRRIGQGPVCRTKGD